MHNENNFFENLIADDNTQPHATEEQVPVQEVAEDSEMTYNQKLYKIWFDKYFLKNFGKFEKKLLDWWTGEGFFGITNVNIIEDGKTIDFILRVGRTAYDEMSDTAPEILKEKTDKIVSVKRLQGWDIYSCKNAENLHLLLKTQKNIDKIHHILMSNFRSFQIISYEYEIVEGQECIKSFKLKTYKKN